MRDNNTVKSGINFFEVLGIVFIILRLCGVMQFYRHAGRKQQSCQRKLEKA